MEHVRRLEHISEEGAPLEMLEFVGAFEKVVRERVSGFPKISSIRKDTAIFRSGSWGGGDSLELEVRLDEKTVSIKYLHTDRDKRMRSSDHTGSVVVDTLVALARERGCRQVIAKRVLPESRGFWEKCGFTESGVEAGINPNYVRVLS